MHKNLYAASQQELLKFIGRQGPPANSCLNVVQNPNLSPDTINNASYRAVMFGNCRITSHALPAGASRQTSIWIGGRGGMSFGQCIYTERILRRKSNHCAKYSKISTVHSGFLLTNQEKSITLLPYPSGNVSQGNDQRVGYFKTLI